jgi:diguanylate cyclase (GGDEF)-like protein
MSVQPRFYEGHLTVADAVPLATAIVRTGTRLFDVALMMGQSDFRYILVEDDSNDLVGIVSTEDFTRYTTLLRDEGVDDWKTRPVEDLMVTRLSAAPATPLPISCKPVAAGSDLSCVPIIEHGRVAGVMTQEDVLVSWSRLEPALRAAGTDDVTGLANRTMFMRRLSEEWDRSLRGHEPLTLLLFDIDYFKQVNDQCGHLAGDAVLTAVGKSIKDSLRSFDVVARIGGDEFAALCFNCNADAIEQPIRWIQDAVQKIAVPESLERGRLTLSIGAAVVQSGFESLTTDDLFSYADACLYRSKAAGRNRAFRVIVEDSNRTVPECVEVSSYSEGSVDYLLHQEHREEEDNSLNKACTMSGSA